MTDIRFDPETHTYWVAGKKKMSVTQVLKSAGVSPDLSHVNAFDLQHSQDLGTAVHAACEYYDDGDLDADSLDESVRPYFDRYLEFLKTSGFEPVETETMIYSKTLDICGTVDRIGWLNDHRVLIDLKTGSKDPATGLQLALYKEIWEDCFPDKPVQELYALYLRPDRYVLQPFDGNSLYPYAVAAVMVARWKNAHR